jgi:CRP/FNR family transcriptional regulator, nitrogen oxide reductase regulator
LNKSISRSERIASLQGLTLFTNLSAADCAAIHSTAFEKRFWRYQTIFCEGDPARHVTVLLSGCVKVTQLGWKGDEVILRVNVIGDMLGDIHPVVGYKHCSTAQAVQPSIALMWDMAIFEKLVDSFPAFRRNMVRALEERLREMEQRFRGVCNEDVSSRLSGELIRLTNRFENGGTRHQEISLSRKELAQLTGASLFTVSRLLSHWQRLGIVSLHREAVQVRDLSALASLAAGRTKNVGGNA